VWNATPTEGGAIHRFFDTSPFSPSGRYLALTRLPFEYRSPQPGDVALVVIVDLQTGEERTVAETRGWDTQVGAHVQWNPQANRIMAVLRWGLRKRGKLRHTLVTMGLDGRDVRVAVPNSIWDRGGHHPNWCPDGETICMNLKLDGENLQFVSARYDGSGLAPLTGSGIRSSHGAPRWAPRAHRCLPTSSPRLSGASAGRSSALARTPFSPLPR